MYASFDDMRRSVTSKAPKTLVVAAAHDARTLEAVFAAAKEFSMKYILVGDRAKIGALSRGPGGATGQGASEGIPSGATGQGASEGVPSGATGQGAVACDIVDATDDADCARKAVSLVSRGAGDVLMKGILDTGTLLKAVLDKDSGIRDSDTLSHLAMFEVPAYHKLISVTDGGMFPNPTLGQKAEIVRNAVAHYGRLGFPEPKVAALCASELVSEKLPDTVHAAELQRMCGRGELGGCLLEGPLSFDIAVSREAARAKMFASEVSGDADILLVPNITAGNVLGKGLIYWGGAKMAGCVLGAKSPIVLASRNASAEEKLFSIMLAIA